MTEICDSEKTVSRSSLAFLSGTFFSRITGLGRDMAMAFVFGANPAIAAFMVAFRFANFIRRLFGEGALPSGFIPHFEQLRAESPQKGAQFFRDLFFSLSLFLVLLILLIEGGLFYLFQFGHLKPANAEILYLMFLMMPGILFICLFGLCSGLLQCEKKYFGTGFAPVAFNCVWILAVFCVKDSAIPSAVAILSLSVILAFFVQWLMIAPQTVSIIQPLLGWKACLRPRLFSKELRPMIKPFLLGTIGIAAVQINSTLDAVFARCASLEGPAYLWYAIRIQQLPLALFGIALSAALLPPLSRAIKEENLLQYLKLLRFSFRRSFSLIFPCTLGMFALGIAGINLLYGHGDFSQTAIYQTVLCLWGYGLGLLPSVFVLLLAPAFYAKKEYRIPTMGAVLSVVLNILLTSCFVFVLKWGALSIALATSLCAWVNYFFLSHFLADRLKTASIDTEVRFSFLKTGVCSVGAFVVTVLVGRFVLGDQTLQMILGREVVFSRNVATQCVHFVVQGSGFVLSFLFFARLVKAEDILALIKKSSPK